MKPASDSARRARPLLGTFVEISAGGAARSDLDAAIEVAVYAVADVHRLMSFHEPDSDVSRLNCDAATRPVHVHPWTFEVLAMARELHEASAGMFDIAIAPVLQHMGLLPRLESGRQSIPMRACTAKTVELLSGRRIRFRDPDVRIDLGGIAKGFAVDRAIEVLRVHGTPRGLVNAGGDLAAFGPDAYTVRIRDPRSPGRLLFRVEVKNEALASSGGCFDPFQSSHVMTSAVIDPNIRRSARVAYGATVRAPSCMVADALTKVVMAAGESAADLLVQYGARAIFMSTDGNLLVTRDWLDGVGVAS